MPIDIKVLKDEDLREALPDLARLRINVFRSWPYIYDGSMDYETRYLQRYAHTDGAVIVGAYEDGQLVGAATGEPLEKEVIQFRRPFEEAGLDPKTIFYLAESVLDPAHRGKGIGHQFFDLREAHARTLGFQTAAFCAVVRPDDHPEKPADYSPLDPFWIKRGYSKLENGIVYFPWRDLGAREETEKPMQVWTRQL